MTLLRSPSPRIINVLSSVHSRVQSSLTILALMMKKNKTSRSANGNARPPTSCLNTNSKQRYGKQRHGRLQLAPGAILTNLQRDVYLAAEGKSEALADCYSNPLAPKRKALSSKSRAAAPPYTLWQLLNFILKTVKLKKSSYCYIIRLGWGKCSQALAIERRGSI
jgi:hypothetical protein